MTGARPKLLVSTAGNFFPIALLVRLLYREGEYREVLIFPLYGDYFNWPLEGQFPSLSGLGLGGWWPDPLSDKYLREVEGPAATEMAEIFQEAITLARVDWLRRGGTA